MTRRLWLGLLFLMGSVLIFNTHAIVGALVADFGHPGRVLEAFCQFAHWRFLWIPVFLAATVLACLPTRASRSSRWTHIASNAVVLCFAVWCLVGLIYMGRHARHVEVPGKIINEIDPVSY